MMKIYMQLQVKGTKTSSLPLDFMHDMQFIDLSSTLKSRRKSVELLCNQIVSLPYGDSYRKGEEIL